MIYCELSKFDRILIIFNYYNYYFISLDTIMAKYLGEKTEFKPRSSSRDPSHDGTDEAGTWTSTGRCAVAAHHLRAPRRSLPFLRLRFFSFDPAPEPVASLFSVILHDHMDWQGCIALH